MTDRLYCPQPRMWNEIYSKLLRAWESKNDGKIPKPPVPLILAAWWEVGLIQKHFRWLDTIKWAEDYGFIELIPNLKEEDLFFG